MTRLELSNALSQLNWDDKLPPALLIEALLQADEAEVDLDCQIHMTLQPCMPYVYRYSEWWVETVPYATRLSSYASYTKSFEDALDILGVLKRFGSNRPDPKWTMSNTDDGFKVEFGTTSATHQNAAIAFCIAAISYLTQTSVPS